MSIEGKVIIVTGATSGIGEGCARYFVERGAKVVLSSNQLDEGNALEADLKSKGLDALFIETNVCDEASVKAAVDQTVAAYGRLDAVHSNAGVWRKGKVTDFTLAEWNAVMGVNVMGNLWLAKYTIPAMEASGGGVLVITTSVAAFVGFPEHALYCASKGALESLIRAVAMDHAGSVRVVGVCPGTIDTPMLAASAEGWTQPIEELYADVARKIPVRRMGTPLDVAKAVEFLISDDAGYINAVSLPIEGGTMALPPW